MDSWVELLKDFGFPMALAIYLLWRDMKNDRAREKRITELNDKIERLNNARSEQPERELRQNSSGAE